jgi:hypothetical protein
MILMVERQGKSPGVNLIGCINRISGEYQNIFRFFKTRKEHGNLHGQLSLLWAMMRTKFTENKENLTPFIVARNIEI